MILITGAGGFLGSTVARKLRQRKRKFATVGRSTAAGAITHCAFDASRDRSRLARILGDLQPRGILHLAGAPPAAKAGEAYAVNAAYFADLVSLSDASVRILAVGSAAEYGSTFLSKQLVDEEDICKPVTSYGISKYAQTMESLAARSRGRETVIARAFNLVGAGMPSHLALGGFLEQMKGVAPGHTLTLRTGPLDRVRDFVPVDFAADVLIDFVERSDLPPPLVHLSTGTGSAIQTWLDAIARVARIELKIEFDLNRMRAFDPEDARGSTRRLRETGMIPPVIDMEKMALELWYGSGRVPSGLGALPVCL